MKLVVVYNAKSGSGLGKTRLKPMMHEAGIEVIEWVAISGQLKKHLKPYIGKGRIIAVIGGDGTQRAVAALVANTETVMAPLPGGTLNHFTKDLRIPQEMEKAIFRLPKLKTKRIDVAAVNGRVFVNNSSIGLYPRSLLEREKAEKSLGKWPAALRGGLSALFRFRRYSLTVNGQTMRAPFVFIGNNHYRFESSMLAERHSLIGGRLTLFVLRSKSRLGMAKTTLVDRFGATRNSDDFTIDTPRKVVIASAGSTKTRKQVAISLDGEVMKLTTPLRYEIRPKSLKVLA